MPQRTPEEKKEYMKQWRAKNKERVDAYTKNYNDPAWHSS